MTTSRAISIYDLIPSDWKTVGGVKIAHTLSYQLNGVEVGKVTYKEVTANPTIASNAFAVPDAVKSAAKAPATGNVPYQWVIRRIALGRFLDSDGIIVPPGGSLKLVELAPNVQHVQGGSANNLIVAMKDHLVVFDAPYGEAAIALGHRRGEEEVSGQADPVPGAHPSSHGSHRRHPHLHGGRGDRDRADAGQGLFREGRAHAAHRGAG